MSKTHDRVHFVDGLRGLAIVGMIFHHTLYDLYAIYSLDIGLLFNPWFLGLLTFGGGLFIFLSGISSRFSRRNLRRGIEIFLFGMALTAITYFFMRDEVIYFGILHFLGISIILYSFLQPLLARVNQLIVLLGGAVAFSLAYYVYCLEIPGEFPFSFLVGFPSVSFFSADYFPVFPWIFLFLAGTGFGWFVAERRLPAFFYRIKLPGFEFVGRNTMWIYLLHQPVIIGVLWLLFLLIK